MLSLNLPDPTLNSTRIYLKSYLKISLSPMRYVCKYHHLYTLGSAFNMFKAVPHAAKFTASATTGCTLLPSAPKFVETQLRIFTTHFNEGQ